MLAKSLKKFFAKSRSESFDREQHAAATASAKSGMRRFYSLDNASSGNGSLSNASATVKVTSSSLYRQPLRQRHVTGQSANRLLQPRGSDVIGGVLGAGGGLGSGGQRLSFISRYEEEEDDDYIDEGITSTDDERGDPPATNAEAALSLDETDSADDATATPPLRSSFSGLLPGASPRPIHHGNKYRGRMRWHQHSMDEENLSTTSATSAANSTRRPRSLSLAPDGQGQGHSILKQKQQGQGHKGIDAQKLDSRTSRPLLRYVQRKPLKKQTSFKEDVDVYYYEDVTTLSTSSSTLSANMKNNSNKSNYSPQLQTTASIENVVEPAAKLFAADVSLPQPIENIISNFPDANSSEAADPEAESSSGILCRCGSSDSVHEVSNKYGISDLNSTEMFSVDSNIANSQQQKQQQPSMKRTNNAEISEETGTGNGNSANNSAIPNSTGSQRRYLLRSVEVHNNNANKVKPNSSPSNRPKALPLAGTVTVTSSADLGDLLRAVIYVTDRRSMAADVRTVVRAMSDGWAIVVTTYAATQSSESEGKGHEPERIEKIALPVQVDPFSMKALVQRQGPLVIEAPVVRGAGGRTDA